MHTKRNVNDVNSFNTSELLRHLSIFFETMVIKYDNEAMKQETPTSKMNSDRYMVALSGRSNVYTYERFSDEVMLQVGLTEYDVQAIHTVMDVPEHLRKKCLELQDKETLKYFEETNNYYRPYTGLPITKEGAQIHAPLEFYDDLGIEMVPVYELDDFESMILEREGYLDELKQEYPDEKFLNYLGTRRVSVESMREAGNFSIMYVNTDDMIPEIYEAIMTTYEKVRELTMTSYYNKNLVKMMPLYENFLAMSVMSGTVQNLIVDFFKKTINKDYFDLDTMRLYYDAYNIPFVKELPLEYHRRFCKNLNYLLSIKGTNDVFYEITKLFDMNRIIFYRYYLIKEHRRDKDNFPLFIYDEHGKLDFDKTYNYYFQLVDFKDTNLITSFRDERLRKNYIDVTENDPYWMETQRLKKKLREKKFNYTSTKYFSMTIMQSMSKILFNIQYQLKLLLDKKADTQLLDVYIPDILGDEPINLFELCVLVNGLTCKKVGFKGNILMNAPAIAKVYGYNIKADVDELIKDALDKPYCNQELKNHLIDLNVNSFNDINRLFGEITNMKIFLEEGMRTTQNKEEYQLYDRLWHTLLVADSSYDVYRIDENNIATTYSEYLSHKNKVVYNYLEGIKKDDIDLALENILHELSELIPEIDYIYSMNESSAIVLNAIVKMILFFKSYTTDLESIDSIHLLNDANLNKIKLIDKVSVDIDVKLKDMLDMAFDGIHSIDVDVHPKDGLLLRDELIIVRD